MVDGLGRRGGFRPGGSSCGGHSQEMADVTDSFGSEMYVVVSVRSLSTRSGCEPMSDVAMLTFGLFTRCPSKRRLCVNLLATRVISSGGRSASVLQEVQKDPVLISSGDAKAIFLCFYVPCHDSTFKNNTSSSRFHI